MLNFNAPIREEDIYHSVGLAQDHPVYRIEGYNIDPVDALVVKLESGAMASVRFNAVNMQIVDPHARSSELTPPEVAALRGWCGPGGLGDVRNLPAAYSMRTALTKPGTWIKMEVKRLVTLDSAVDHRLQGDKADVRLVAAGLKRPGGLETLGRIIAADLFNGTRDRFYYNPQQPTANLGDNYPGVGKLHHLGNVGNVFVEIGPSGVSRPVGLDNFDPFGDFKDVNVPVLPASWPGMLLGETAAQKRTFAGRVIEDLERLLGPRSRKVKFASTTRLGTRRKDRLVEGIEDGAARLRLAVRNYANATAHPPAGVTSRLNLLGW